MIQCPHCGVSHNFTTEIDEFVCNCGKTVEKGAKIKAPTLSTPETIKQKLAEEAAKGVTKETKPLDFEGIDHYIFEGQMEAEIPEDGNQTPTGMGSYYKNK